MEVEDHVNPLARTVIHDPRNDALIITLIGALAAEPIVLVQREADDGGMPSGHRHLGDRKSIPPIPAGRAFPGAGEFQPIHIHTLKGDRTAARSL